MIYNAYSNTSEGLLDLSLNSAGHIFAADGRRIDRPKGREDWLLFYVAKGREHFTLKKEIIAEAGSFIFFKPGERQTHIHIGDSIAEFYYIHFNAPEDFDLLDFKSFTVYSVKPSARIQDLFESVIDELQRKEPCYEKVSVSLLLEIISLLARRTVNQNSPHERYIGPISFVIQQMNKEYASTASLDDYAQMCRMSKYHFLRIFREITGVSPIEYRNRIRIEHAKELLEDRSVSIGEIGAQVGFSSPSYFCDAFKKKIGHSPAEYRRKFFD